MNKRSLEVDYCINPRDLVHGFIDELLELDVNAEFLVIVLDPRDRRSMTIQSRVHPARVTGMIHHAIDALLIAASKDAQEGSEQNPQE